MHDLIFITDLDLSEVHGGIGVYMKNLLAHLPARNTTLIGKNKDDGHYDADKTVCIDAKDNYEYMRKLSAMKKDFVKPHSILISQRPDFMRPFLNFPNRKIVTVHGDPASIIRKKKGLLTYIAYRIIERQVFRRCDKLIFIDKRTYDKYTRGSKQLRKKSIEIPPGVDMKRFKKMDRKKARDELVLPRDKNILLYVGRLEPEKNVGRIVDEFRRSAEDDEMLVIAGKGREHKRISEKTKDDGRIRMMSIENKKMPLLMNASDCLTLMSESEGVPTVILESLACGVPVVTRDVGDAAMIVKDGKNGLIAEPDNMMESFRKILGKDWTKKCTESVNEYSWKEISKKVSRAIA